MTVDTTTGARAGRYTLVGPLGEGASAVTFEARDPDGRPVALKRLALSRLKNWKQLDLFEREARVLRNLDHPAIPRYLDAFEEETPEGPCFCLVQELFPGRSLKERLASGWRPTVPEVRRIAEELLEVLVYLQSLHPPVIHRDLKPGNILLRDEEDAHGRRVGLVDFGGVADACRQASGEGSTVVGTFGYMAPEQFRAQSSAATDLYGLGATLLHLLSGRPPSELPVHKLKPDVRAAGALPDDLAVWLDRMLEPDQADRFATAAEALELLRTPGPLTRPAAGSAAPGITPTSSTVARLGAGLRRQLSLRTVLLLALLAAGGGYLYQKRRPDLGGGLRGQAAAELVYLKPALDIGQQWSAVFDVAFAPDGKTLASAANDSTVKVFSVADGSLVRAFAAHRPRGGAVAFSPDGRLLATAADRAVLVFEVASGKLRQRLVGPRSVIARVVFNPSGRHVAAAGLDGRVLAWAVDSGTLMLDARHGDGQKLLTLAFGPDGQLLFTGGDDKRVEVRHFPGGKLAQTLAGHRSAITHLAVAPDGQTVVTASDDRTLGVWLLGSGARLATLKGHQHEVWSVVLDRTGRRAFSASRDGTVPIWDLYGGRQLAAVAGDHRGVLTLALSADDTRLAIGTGSGRVRVFQLGQSGAVRAQAGAIPGYDEDVRLRPGWTPLHVAAFEGQLDEVKRILEEGQVAVDVRSQLGRTPLYNAAKAGHLPVVSLLVERGADVNASDHGRRVPMVVAIDYGRDEVFRFLLKKGADPRRRVYDIGSTLLSVAARTGRVAMMRELLALGLPLNGFNAWNQTPLLEAVKHGQTEAIDLLLAQPNVDVRRAEVSGYGPLHTAADQGDDAVVSKLLAAGADVDQPGPDGWTALQLARHRGQLSTVILLREKGAR